jgi:hypothetical protein
MGSHRESPETPLLSSGSGAPPLRLRPHREGRDKPWLAAEKFSNEEFLRRWDITLRRVERLGLRGQNAEAVAIALLILEDSPDLLQKVTKLDVRSGVKTARRAEVRRHRVEQEAARRRPEADASQAPPTLEERREARRLLAALLEEGARSIPRPELQAFAHRLLERWRRDPGSVLDAGDGNNGSMRSVFAALLRSRDVQLTEVKRDPRFERILLRGLKLWECQGPPWRRHRRRLA